MKSQIWGMIVHYLIEHFQPHKGGKPSLCHISWRWSLFSNFLVNEDKFQKFLPVGLAKMATQGKMKENGNEKFSITVTKIKGPKSNYNKTGFKGTGSQDRFQILWQKFTDVGLN